TPSPHLLNKSTPSIRVSLVEPIADDMKPLIGDEKYLTILNSETPQDKMRKLLNFLTTTKLKDKLYQSLLKNELISCGTPVSKAVKE
uniref:CARD domain-containing protein n=1 Tax=Sinocyclocheilus grahami TaxID=75366 RepID=A0A672LBI2_SINGR